MRAGGYAAALGPVLGRTACSLATGVSTREGRGVPSPLRVKPAAGAARFGGCPLALGHAVDVGRGGHSSRRLIIDPYLESASDSETAPACVLVGYYTLYRGGLQSWCGACTKVSPSEPSLVPPCPLLGAEAATLSASGWRGLRATAAAAVHSLSRETVSPASRRPQSRSGSAYSRGDLVDSPSRTRRPGSPGAGPPALTARGPAVRERHEGTRENTSERSKTNLSNLGNHPAEDSRELFYSSILPDSTLGPAGGVDSEVKEGEGRSEHLWESASVRGDEEEKR